MYKNFYKLKNNPFRLTPDPKFFFSSKTHKRALAYLRYGIEQGEGFIIITGNVGSGKTILMSRLLKSLNTRNLEIANVVNSQLQPVDLLRMISAEFNLNYTKTSKASLIKNIELFAKDCVDRKKRVLVVIDEAQNLAEKSLEELRMLLNLQHNGRQLIQAFLLGQKEFRNMIRGSGFEQLRQRVIATYHLQPLSLEETKNYIEYRLKVAGWEGDPKIEEQVYFGVYKFTKGLPRKINLFVDRLFLYGCLEELHHIKVIDFKNVLNDIQDEYWNDDGAEELFADAKSELLLIKDSKIIE